MAGSIWTGGAVSDSYYLSWCYTHVFEPWPNSRDCDSYQPVAWFTSCTGGSCDFSAALCSGADGVCLATFVSSTEDPVGTPTGPAAGSPGGGASGSTVVNLVVGPPFNLSAADGAMVGAAIIAVWLAAFFWRALIRTLNTDGYGDGGD